MFLSIDIGNTWQKVAIFNQDGQQVDYFQVAQLNTDILQSYLDKYPIQAVIYSSVGQKDNIIEGWLTTKVPTYEFSARLKLPITLAYQTPHTLGTDRIASAIGGRALFPNQPVLVIQAGTCLVTDFVTQDGQYLGGSISPGLHMRLDSLHHFTARLPQEAPEWPTPITGQTTHESILSGVLYGMAFEIDGFIQHYTTQHPNLAVILTGGDAPLLSNLIKNRIFAAPNLVLLGLYKTLIFNVSET